MKTACEIIKDLLPLYYDGVCSEESKKLVSEHLEECEKCKSELSLMSSPAKASPIKLEDEKIIKASAAAWKKRKHQSFFVGCVVALIAVVLVVGCFVSFHWFSTVNENDIEALKKQASDFYNGFEEEKFVCEEILDMKKRGNYLAVLLKSIDNKYAMCVFEKDSLFENRLRSAGGTWGFNQKLGSWNAGSPSNEAILVFCGADIPEEACWYTFQNANITYTCPIVNGMVLDLFVIPDGGGCISGCPIMLDSEKREIVQ